MFRDQQIKSFLLRRLTGVHASCQGAIVAVIAVVLTSAPFLSAQTAEPDEFARPAKSGQAGATGRSLLRELNNSMETLVARVSPAVVQVAVSGYGLLDEQGEKGVPLFGRQRGIGSGVIVDSSGYIITNAHVVEGAQQIKVILPPPAPRSKFEVKGSRAGHVLTARLVGADHESDLAVLKVDATDLPTLSLTKSQGVRQGQLVFAVGSPEGLDNSVTMGVVSSPLRQPDPDSSMVYIQTDASINPGNSGGPLVDVEGALVGINTMILTQGGGSDGIGFAIPVSCVRFIYQNLRRHGRVYRAEISARVQAITADLASGLGLVRKWGVIVSDVSPGGLSAAAGLQVGDIVISIDGHPIFGVPGCTAALYLHPLDQPVEMEVLRGNHTLSLAIPVLVHHEESEDPPVGRANLLMQLGVFAVDLDEQAQPLLVALRSDSGVLVVGRATNAASLRTGLQPGDVIRMVNHTSTQSLGQLRTVLNSINEGQAIVLQIERNGHLQYLAFELNG